MLMYRWDLADKAGVKFAERPTWNDVRDAAAKMHDPKAGVYGICLRGKPGWGDNMAFITTMVNSFGGQWFDMGWKPQLESKPRQEAITFYVDLLKKYGPPARARTASTRSWRSTTRASARCGSIATIAASFITDLKQSKVANKVAFAQGPTAPRRRAPTGCGPGAGDSAGTKNAADAQKFITWATRRNTSSWWAKTNGWGHVPTGTRKSTYANPEFLKAAVFAEAEKKAIDSANPERQHAAQEPHVGVQFAAIPEFQAIGIAVGQQMSAALSGKTSVAAA